MHRAVFSSRHWSAKPVTVVSNCSLVAPSSPSPLPARWFLPTRQRNEPRASEACLADFAPSLPDSAIKLRTFPLVSFQSKFFSPEELVGHFHITTSSFDPDGVPRYSSHSSSGGPNARTLGSDCFSD